MSVFVAGRKKKISRHVDENSESEVSFSLLMFFFFLLREVQQVLSQSASDSLGDRWREEDGVVGGGADRGAHPVVLQVRRWVSALCGAGRQTDPESVLMVSVLVLLQVLISPRLAERTWTSGLLETVKMHLNTFKIFLNPHFRCEDSRFVYFLFRFLRQVVRSRWSCWILTDPDWAERRWSSCRRSAVVHSQHWRLWKHSPAFYPPVWSLRSTSCFNANMYPQSAPNYCLFILN